ncbi:MAG: hypothetical protein HY719_16280, partial [Planctomycetes bacterium]|nr:hypothetical protein [Planctomycetota bacterium]
MDDRSPSVEDQVRTVVAAVRRRLEMEGFRGVASLVREPGSHGGGTDDQTDPTDPTNPPSADPR